MTSREMHQSIRALLLDVLDQCARHMEEMPLQRKQFQPIAYAVHAALEDFERQFRLDENEDRNRDRDRMLFTRAQDMSLEWLQSLQELRAEQHPDQTRMDAWPLWRSDGLNETRGVA